MRGFDRQAIATAEGHDRVLATNLLSPFVLTQTLLPALTRGGPSRIVNIGSSTSDRARIDPEHWCSAGVGNAARLQPVEARADDDDLRPGQTAGGHRRGGQCGASRPGGERAGSDGRRNRPCLAKPRTFARTEEQGADTPLYAALAPESATAAASISRIAGRLTRQPSSSGSSLVEQVWRPRSASPDALPSPRQQLRPGAASAFQPELA